MDALCSGAVFLHYRRAARSSQRIHLGFAVLITVIVATCLRVTLRDRVTGLATLYYATPPPILAVLCVLASILLGWGGHCFHLRARRTIRGLSIVSLLAAAGFLAWFRQAHWYSNSGSSAAPGIASAAQAAKGNSGARLLFWNMSGGSRGLAWVADVIRSYDADVVGLVESRPSGEWTLNWWARSFPEYRMRGLAEGITLLSRFPIERVECGKLSGMGLWGSARVAHPSTPMTLIVVDVWHDLHRSRGPALDALAERVEAFEGEPLVILGDFNTPPESVHFERLRRTFSNVFEMYGDGCNATWPTPIPLLALDQVWCSQRLEAVRCGIGWTLASDHCPIWAELKSRP